MTSAVTPGTLTHAQCLTISSHHSIIIIIISVDYHQPTIFQELPGNIITNILIAHIYQAQSLTTENTLILFTQSIAQLTDIYQRLLTPEITLILFIQSIAQLTHTYQRLLTPISISPGLLWDVFYWYAVKYRNFESYQQQQTHKLSQNISSTLCIFSVDFQEC